MSSGLIDRVFLLLLYFSIHHSASLSTYLNISMQSVNMKHILKWSPLQTACSTFNHTVQFQGEYELHKLNGSWVDAYDCQEIRENRCDLTHDLASNSDYSIRIKTNCAGQKLWTQLPETFNRKDTVLLTPKMIVNVEKDPIQVGFSTTLSDITVNLKVWKEGEEQNASIHMIRAHPYHFSIAAHQGEKKMCFRAEALVDAINKSCSTDTQCVIIPRQTSDMAVIVSFAVVIAVAVALILGWSVTRFSPQIKHIVCHRETIPSALLNNCPTRAPILLTLTPEPTDPLLLFVPAEHQCTSMQTERNERRTLAEMTKTSHH